MKKNQANYTVAGTDIEEVKRQNANSGLSYNELNEWFAQKYKEENASSQTEFGKEVAVEKIKK